MEDEENDDRPRPQSTSSTRKRKVCGRMSEVKKKLLSATHELGPDCRCKRYKCFESTTDVERANIISTFNTKTVNEQNSYLSGLINLNTVGQRRPRQAEEHAKFHGNSYSYRISVKKEESVVEMPVCVKAFRSIHGISKKKVEVIQKYLKKGGTPKDGRGQHLNRKHRLSVDVYEAIRKHISSFKGERSHHSLKTSSKVYLPPDLNITKMYALFKAANPNFTVSYEKYRTIFNTEFNIGFGYPRMDTCSACDRFAADIRAVEIALKSSPEGSCGRTSAEKKLRELTNDKKLHLLKSNMFYIRKRTVKVNSKMSNKYETIAMDFQKNLQVPNITTINDVYYKKQLTFCMFNIHILSTDESYLFVYPETVGYKGANEVASFLYFFVMTILNPSVKELNIFCDSCGGQNKNWTLFRTIHFIVHQTKRLERIQMHFPIRGHSYLECDRNMASINQKKWVKLPQDWIDEIESARAKPSPFHVVEVERELIRDWTAYLDKLYVKKCPFPSRPVRELAAVRAHPRFLKHRSTFHGHWDAHVINAPDTVPQDQPLTQGEFFLPDYAHTSPLPITYAKYVDLQVLKMFCGEEARLFYAQLPKLDKGMKRKPKDLMDGEAVYPQPKKSKAKNPGKKKTSK